jgi:hypothetical protein
LIKADDNTFAKSMLEDTLYVALKNDETTKLTVAETTKAYMRLKGYAQWDNEITELVEKNYRISTLNKDKEDGWKRVAHNVWMFVDVNNNTELKQTWKHSVLPEAYEKGIVTINENNTFVYHRDFIEEAIIAYNKISSPEELDKWQITKTSKLDFLR